MLFCFKFIWIDIFTKVVIPETIKNNLDAVFYIPQMWYATEYHKNNVDYFIFILYD